MQATIPRYATGGAVLLSRVFPTEASARLLPFQAKGSKTREQSTVACEKGIERERGNLIMVSALERHYSPREIAEMWGWSVKSVIRRFYNEPGVLKVERPETRSKRRYSQITIPESVLLRVHERLVVKK
jgi:hypothetical protein